MTIYTRHNEILVLDRKPATVEAVHYNLALTALKHRKQPIRFKIPSLNHLDLLIQKDAWIVVDRVLHDMPIAAWADFQTEQRDNLHEPIACEVRLYHFAARMILQPTLDKMQDTLRQIILHQDAKETERGLLDKKINN